MTRAVDLLNLTLPNHKNPRIVWRGLHGAATSLAVAEVLDNYPGTVCVITQSAGSVERLARELKFFGGDAPIRQFPDYETLPYEAISPSKDLLSDRLRSLYQLAHGETVKLLVNADALLNRLPPPEFILSRSLQLRVGEEIDPAELAKTLVQHGYFRVDQVNEPGELAVRGALIDIFPAGLEQPVRVDLFDKEIESIRLFDPQSQLSHAENLLSRRTSSKGVSVRRRRH